jgi:serine/threonine protein kinase
MSMFSPESFGRYYLVDKIAVGGMAEVFKAKTFSHGGFEKLLVIKRILGHLSENDEFVEMFVDEAKISVELQHPNIIQVFDFGRLQDNYYIAMECVEGKDTKGILRRLAERRKLLPNEYAVYVAHEICKGLDYAHKCTSADGERLGIIHRDISPSNILVSYTGEVKIADFGIAKATISAYNTKDGVLKGKFEYMSPEQASGDNIDLRSDVFSTGIILHEMLTGRRLFKTESDLQTLERIKRGDVQPPSTLNPAVPPRLDALVMRALSVDRDERFQDARALQTALLEFMYPATPDLVRESLSHFMRELFSAEIRGEQERLKEGTRLATQLFEATPEIDLDEEWVQSPGSGVTMQRAPTSKAPLIAMGLLLLGVLGTAGWLWTQQPAAQTQEPKTAPSLTAPAGQTASIRLEVFPSVLARVYIDGESMGRGSEWTFRTLPVDQPIALRIEADGYDSFAADYTLDAGERRNLPIRLVKTLVVQSPEDAKRSAERQAQREAERVEAASKASEAKKTEATVGRGKLSVVVKSGWGQVYIDGKLIEATPLYNHPLKAGRHRVIVVSGATGERKSRTVTIVPGEATRLSF